MLYGLAARAVLSRLEPEAAQRLVLRTVALAGLPADWSGREPQAHQLDLRRPGTRLHQLGAKLALPHQRPAIGRHKLFDRNLSGLLGLAGGADKNAAALAGWRQLGLSFVEVGTITFKPRAGNPGTRLWHYPGRHALVNWMGLPNDGFEVVAKRLHDYRDAERARGEAEPFCIGVSLSSAGKTDEKKDTPTPAQKVDNLTAMATALSPHVDFFTLNVSCPNVAAHGADLAASIAELQAVVAGTGFLATGRRPRPVLVKLAPTDDMRALLATVQALKTAGAAGFVVTNTVKFDDRALLPDDLELKDWTKGGYSGPSLLPIGLRMTAMIRAAAPDAVIIGVGGIQSVDGAQAYLNAGADAVQAYTGLVEQGPALIRRINQQVRRPALG